MALELTLARLLLRDFGPLVPRPLLPGLWWRCRPWVARSCSPGHITASVLVPGPWTCIPSPFHGLARCGGLCMSPLFEMLSVLFPGNMGISFLRNLSFRLRYRLIPSLPRAPSIFMPGLIRKRGWECWSVWVFIHQLPWLLILQHGSQVSHTGVNIPPKLESAFYSAGKYSVGTNGVLRKLKHIFPNTYQRINMMARLPPR